MLLLIPFNHHVDSVCQKANQKLSFLRRNLKQCNRKVKLDAYKISLNLKLCSNSVVSSHYMQYYKLESVQKRAACFIVRDYRRTSSITRIPISLSLKSISYLELISTKMQLLMFYKIVHKLVELPLPETYIIASDLLEEMNSNSFCHKLPSILTNIIFPRSINLWNRLPVSNDCTLVLYSNHFSNE